MLITLLAISIGANAQTNYYISPSGSNSNNGLLATPWQTIQYGIGQANNGDTLNLFTGTYNEKVNVTKSLTIRNQTGNTPILSGTGVTTQDAMIAITNQTNVTIDGLEIANNIQNAAQGILVDGICQNITIKNCKLHDIHFSSNPSAPVNAGTNAQGIIVYGTNASTAISNLKINNNTLYNCRLGYSEGIAVNGNVDGFEVIGNLVHDITNIGIDLIGHEGTCSNPANDQARNGLIKNNLIYNCISAYATSGGLYVDGGKNIIIENNTSYHNGYGVEVGCENVGKTTDNITVRNNIFYDNQVCAIALGGFDYPAGSGKVINSEVRNNTCYKNDFLNGGTGELYLSYSEKSVVENNIFYLSNQNSLVYANLTQLSLQFNYNVFFSDNTPTNMTADWNGNSYLSYSSFTSGTGTNANSQVANPQFVNGNITAPNFHIASTSPAKEAGNPAFVAALNEADMDGENRISGIVDCGADEYYATVGIHQPISSDKPSAYSLGQNYPNPFNPMTTITFALPSKSFVSLKVFDALGRDVATLVSEELPAGTYSQQWNAPGFPSGVYFYRLQASSTIETKKLILLR